MQRNTVKAIPSSEGTVFRSVSNLNISFQFQICANFENNASFELQSRFYVICFAEKQALDGSKPEPAIRSCDTGHRKPCFDSCHFTATRPRKFPPRKYNISPSCRVDCKLPSHSPSACTDGTSNADVIIGSLRYRDYGLRTMAGRALSFVWSTGLSRANIER